MSKLRTAIYLRVSTDDQTTDNQRMKLEKLCELREWVITAVYEDHAVSGAKKRSQRPQFDQLLKDARKRRFDRVVCWSVDRFGRSTAQVTTAMEELQEVGVDLYFHQESMDTSTAHGQAMLEMAAVFAKLERSMITERVKAGLQRAKAQGKDLGRPKVSAEIEQKVKRLLGEGSSVRKAAKAAQTSVSVVQRIKREAAI